MSSTPSARRHRNTISPPLSTSPMVAAMNSFRLGVDRLSLGALGWRRRCFRVPARQPAHHPPQLLADNFDGMPLLRRPQFGKLASAGCILGNPLAGKGAILDARKNFPHRGSRLIPYRFRAASQVAVFGRVRNRMPHPSQAAFVDEIHDELHLMQTLEV